MDAEQIRQDFERDGYCLVPGVFGPAATAKLEAEFDTIVAQLRRSGDIDNARWDSASVVEHSADTELIHTHHVERFSRVWLDAFLDEGFGRAAEAILGPDIVLHHSKLFEKPAGKGAPFPMHQDWAYFPTHRDSMIAAIIHLSDTPAEAGCFRTYPSSHNLGRQTSASGYDGFDDADQFARFSEKYPVAEATPHPARQGDVMFFSYLTIHGSGPNLSSQPRKTVLAQLYPATDEPEPEVEHSVIDLVIRGRNHRANRLSVNSPPGRASSSAHSTPPDQDRNDG